MEPHWSEHTRQQLAVSEQTVNENIYSEIPTADHSISRQIRFHHCKDMNKVTHKREKSLGLTVSKGEPMLHVRERGGSRPRGLWSSSWEFTPQFTSTRCVGEQ